MIKAAYFCNAPQNIEYVYGQRRREILAQRYDMYPEIITQENIGQHLKNLENVEYIFSTWGMFQMTDEMFEKMPKLKGVFYGAGSVKSFAEPYLRRGITVSTAAKANGEFVTTLAYGQVLLAGSGYFHCFRTEGYNAENAMGKPDNPGFFDIRIGIIGAGFIGRQMIERLKSHPGLSIGLYDPCVDEKEAEKLGVTKMTLDELFAACQVVSNHAPNIPATEHMIKKEHFLSMPQSGVFINTGRGMTVDEPGMTAALKERKDVIALLDVTWPEPPPEDSPLLHMPNIFYTRHIAGARGQEVHRMADLAIEEAARMDAGEKPLYSVSLEQLPNMA